MIAVWGFSVPILAAILIGLWAGRTDPQTPSEFGVTAVWAIVWVAGITLLWQALWISALLPAPWYDTLTSAFYWTLGTGTIWLPVLMISFVARALARR